MTTTTGLREQLEHWREAGELSPLDLRFGLFVARESGSEALGLLAAVTSRQQRLGHVCLDPRLAADALPGADLETAWREIEVLESPWLGRSEGEWCPLVLERGRLYLGRLHHAECGVARRVRAWSTAPAGAPPDPARVRRLFPEGGRGNDGQRLAAVLAAVRPFTVVTGGPGTGKTTTVVKVLAMRLAARPDLAIRLLAPTGKAAARLSESIRASRQRLDLEPELVARIPERVTTVHRFLGLGRGHPRHDRYHPAPVDLVVLDEASMTDLPTMHRLLEALPERASLILLGDPDQLASVQAGSVLADLVAPARAGVFTPATRRLLQAAGVEAPPSPTAARPVDDTLARLHHSHRFSAERGIGRLAAAVQAGEGDWETLQEIAAGHDEVECLEWQGDRLPPAALDGLLEDLDPARHPAVDQALDGLGRARCLCALRSGPSGVEGLNALIAGRLGRPLLPAGHGLPVLVTRNAHALGVFNGDMGVLWQERDGRGVGRLRACFRDPEGEILRLPPAELPGHETAYALTVHKSQGSEYDRVLLVLPPEPHPLVTRELIYTALTRARHRVRVVASRASWEAGVAVRTRRASGLAERLLDP